MSNIPLEGNQENATQDVVKKSKYRDLVDKALLREGIINGEELTQDYVMNKRNRILKNHIENVYPIKKMYDRGKEKYYTKLTPGENNHATKVSARSLEELEDKIIAYYIELDLRNRTTVSDILERAIAELEPLTAVRHRQIFNKRFSSIKDKKISALSEEDIRGCLQEMICEGIKSKAFNNAVSTLNKINDYCVYNHIGCVDIRQKITEFRKYKMVGKHVFDSSRKREYELAFNEKEAVSIIRYALDNPDYINLARAALITTGIRVGELLALKPEDINLDKSLMYVEKMEKTKTYELVDYCKDNSERTVFLNSDAKIIFKKLLELRENDDSTCEYLFLNSNSDDGKLHLRAVDNRLRKIQHILNMTDYIPERSPHDCRRTYASIQYLHGVDIKTIQGQLGHSNAQQTWDYIRDIIDSDTRARSVEKGCIL